MNMFAASFMFIGLFAVSIAHLLWAFGRTWPIRDEKLLAQTVIGTAGVERMPPRLASFGVALCTMASGVVALALADHDSGGDWLNVVGIALALIYLARGVVGYTRWWAERRPDPIFRFNDRRVYSPLCLFLAAGYLVLVYLRFN